MGLASQGLKRYIARKACRSYEVAALNMWTSAERFGCLLTEITDKDCFQRSHKATKTNVANTNLKCSHLHAPDRIGGRCRARDFRRLVEKKRAQLYRRPGARKQVVGPLGTELEQSWLVVS